MTDVTLTWSEFQEAAHVGASRVTKVVFKKLKNPRGAETETIWQQHIEGAIAERIVAKHLNQYWHGLGEDYGSDVGGSVEVKSAPEHSHNLIVPVDQLKPDARYYLVTGKYNDRRIQGWMMGSDISTYEIKNFNGRGDAYFVPRHKLNQTGAAQ